MHNRKHGNTTHGHVSGGKHSPTYTAWRNMLDRCRNPNREDYSRYGARGISVCLDWDYFQNFLEDMGECPEGLTLDRIDSAGDYCPDNCRWATMKEQQRNRRNNRLLTHNGQTRCLSEWSEIFQLRPGTLLKRLALGWPTEKALTYPVRGQHATY